MHNNAEKSPDQTYADGLQDQVPTAGVLVDGVLYPLSSIPFTEIAKELRLVRTMQKEEWEGKAQAISDTFALDPEQLDFGTVNSLWGYLEKSDGEKTERLIEALGRFDGLKGDDSISDEERVNWAKSAFASAFTNTDFGDDLGDRLLNISEKMPAEDVDQVCTMLNYMDGAAEYFSSRFARYDVLFAIGVERALTERFADVIAAFESVADHQNINEDMGFAGKLKVEDFNEAFELAWKLSVSLRLISTIIDAPDMKINEVAKSSNFTAHRFSSKEYGDAIIYIRPEGTRGYDSEFEYGRRGKHLTSVQQGAEASISFLINPDDPHKLLFGKPENYKGMSIRFDREGRRVDQAPDDPSRDPTREEGSISLDLSSLFGGDTETAVRIGRLVAFGNKKRASEGYIAESLHHNNAGFNQRRYGSAEGFKELAMYLQKEIALLQRAQSE